MHNPLDEFFLIDVHISWWFPNEQWSQCGTIMHHFLEENITIFLVCEALVWVLELQVLPLGTLQGPQDIAECIKEVFSVCSYCCCGTVDRLPVCH